MDHDCELVAADPEDLLVRTRVADENARQCDQRAIAFGMAVGVVRVLEVVEVEENQRERLAELIGLLERAIDVLVEGAPVAEAGERVAASLLVAERELAPRAERAGGDVRDRADEVDVQLELDVGRHHGEEHAEVVAVRDQRQRERCAVAASKIR